MTTILLILIIIEIIAFILVIYVVRRLNKYIGTLEVLIETSINKNNKLHKALQKAIKNNMLTDSGDLDLLIEEE